MHRSSPFVLIFAVASLTPAHADTAFSYQAGSILYNNLSLSSQSDTAGYVQSADLDGDGDYDLIVTGATYPTAGGSSRGGQAGKILFNTGNNVFEAATGDVPLSEHAREILVRDFNGDSILDIYIADHGYDVAPFPGFPNQLLLGTGTGFSDVSQRLPDIAAFTHNAAAADIDSDGDIDILALNSDTSADELSYLLLNDGQANFTLNRTRLPDSLVTPGQLKNSYSAELADLDNDGYPDLIIGRNQYTELTPTRIHWNDGTGRFSDSVVTYLDEIDVFNNLETLTVIDIQGVDLNADGRRDLLVHAYNADGFTGFSMQLFINSGARQFSNETVRLLGASALDSGTETIVPATADAIDINADGILDLILHQSTGTAGSLPFLFEGTGNGCFEAVTMADVSADTDARFRLGKIPLVSAGAFGYAELFVTESNSQHTLVSNYVPVTITARTRPANYYHSCSGKLKFALQIAGGAIYTSDFSLVATAPDIIVQVDVNTVVELFEPREKIAEFDGATGLLTVPELVVNGEVALRNLVFVISDAEKLQFRLQSYE